MEQVRMQALAGGHRRMLVQLLPLSACKAAGSKACRLGNKSAHCIICQQRHHVHQHHADTACQLLVIHKGLVLTVVRELVPQPGLIYNVQQLWL